MTAFNLGGASVRLWWLPLDEDTSFEEWGYLSEDEKQRAARFADESLRRRFTRSRVHLRRVLGEELGVAPGSLQFERGPFGKPYLAGSRCHFNLSHADGWLVLAVSWDAPVGVDAERVREGMDLESLAPTVFSSEELVQWSQSDERVETFFRSWTAKEALLKAHGTGLAVEPSSAEIRWESGGVMRARVHGDIDFGKDYRLRGIELSPGFFGALAVRAV